jgi:hypothetical protein
MDFESLLKNRSVLIAKLVGQSACMYGVSILVDALRGAQI